MKDLLGFTVIGGMIAFCIWGLLNPGTIKQGWGDVDRVKRPGIPASPGVLIGGLIFATMCGALLILKSINRLDTVSLVAIISVAMGAWSFAVIADRRDARKRNQRNESD